MAGYYNPNAGATLGLEWFVDSNPSTVVLDSATKARAQLFAGAASKVAQSIAPYGLTLSGLGTWGVEVYSSPYVAAIPQTLVVEYAGTDTNSDFTSPYNGNAAWLTQGGGAATYASVSPGADDTTYLRNVNQLENPTAARLLMCGANATQLAGVRVCSVEVWVRVKCTLVTQPTFAGNLNISGIDYTASGKVVPIGGGYSEFQLGYWELNPSTQQPWTLPQINNIITTGATDKFGLLASWNAAYTASYADTIRISKVYMKVRYQPEDRCGYGAAAVTGAGWQTWSVSSIPNLLTKQDSNLDTLTGSGNIGSWVNGGNTTTTNDSTNPGGSWTRSIKMISTAAGNFGATSGLYPCIATKTYAIKCYAQVTSGKTTTLSLLFYDANSNLLQTSSSAGDVGTGAFKAIGMTAVATAPAGATQFQVQISTVATAASQTCYATGIFVGLDQAALNYVRDSYPGTLAKIKVDGGAVVAHMPMPTPCKMEFRRINGTGVLSLPSLPAGSSSVGMPLGQSSAQDTLQDSAGALLTNGAADTPVTAIVTTSLHNWDATNGPLKDYSQPYASRITGNVYTGNTLELEASVLSAQTYVAARLLVAAQVDPPAAALSLKWKRRSDGGQEGGTATINPTDLVQIIPPNGSIASRTTPQIFVVSIPTPAASSVDTGTDGFHRTNNTTSAGSADTSQAWTAATGTWGILNNELYRPTSAAAYDILIQGTPGAINGWAELTQGSSVQDSQGLVFRYVDTSNFWLVQRTSAFGTWNIYKQVAAAFTFMGNTGTSDVGSGAVVRANYNGNNIYIYVDGNLCATFNDSALASTGTKVGIAAASTVTSAQRWANFRWGSQHYLEASSTAALGQGWTLHALDDIGPTGDGFSADGIIFGNGVDAWTDPVNGGRSPHRNAIMNVQTQPAAPTGLTSTVVSTHIALAWSGTGGNAEVWRNDDRSGLDSYGYVQIADLTAGTLAFNDAESRRGVNTTYKVRLRRTDGSYSQFTSATSPVFTPTTGYTHWFVSNESPFSTYIVANDINASVTWTPPDERVFKEFSGRDGVVTFIPLEDPLDEWERELVLYRNGAMPTYVGRGAFTALESLCKSSLSYVCVLDADGNRWYASVGVKQLSRDQNGNFHKATVHVREATRSPSTPTISPS